MSDFVILTDATADHVEALLDKYPDFDVIGMNVALPDREYRYGGRYSNITCKEFYDLQRDNNYWYTSSIAPGLYYDCFENYLLLEKDIIYLSFSSGMSSTYQNACIVANELNNLFPQRKITCVDTLNGSTPQGFLVREALRKKEEGYCYEELVEWVNQNKLSVGVYFSVDTMEHLVHGGRISKTAAAVGSTLNIKPMLTINRNGMLEVIAKPIGMHRALNVMVNKMKEEWISKKGKYVLICHGDDEKRAQKFKKKIENQFPEAEVEIGLVDPIIGAHTGPGMISLCFWSSERK